MSVMDYFGVFRPKLVYFVKKKMINFSELAKFKPRYSWTIVAIRVEIQI